MQGIRTKCESNRTSKKNSPNNTIHTAGKSANHSLIREAKTKPASPERHFSIGYAAKTTKHKKGGSGSNAHISGTHYVN